MTITLTNIPFPISKDSLSFEEFMQTVEAKEDEIFGRMIDEADKGDLVSHDEVMKALLS